VKTDEINNITTVGLYVCYFLRYSEYQSSVVTPVHDSSQQSVTSFFGASTKGDKYGPTHSQKKAISQSIIEDLIVKYSLPISIVENVNFRHFVSVVYPKYTPMSRPTV
jgi:hypothetical protein